MSHVVQYEIDPQLTKQLESLKVAFMHHPNSSVETRISLLKKIRTQLVTAEHDFIAASNKDFGNRCTFDTQMADFMPVIGGLDHIIKHLKSWLKPSKRKVGIQFAPSKAHVEYVPKGVVGVISPWNYPIQLLGIQILQALVAGNRVTVKPSENAPRSQEALIDAFWRAGVPRQDGPRVGRGRRRIRLKIITVITRECTGYFLPPELVHFESK